MYSYNAERLNEVIAGIIRANVTPDAWDWLQEAGTVNNIGRFNTSFVVLPRKTGRAVISVTDQQKEACLSARPGLSVEGWSADRLGRVWLLMQLDPSEKESYQQIIENLFLAAEMNELVALYSSLPVLAYPEIWVKRCAEGIRSNIDSVLEAIMYLNPYPSENLPEPAWNQLVLKALFTNKRFENIIGLDLRANSELAHTLTDYAKERWAAKRKVNPMLWRPVGKFIDERILNDIRNRLKDSDPQERGGMWLALSQSGYEPARTLLDEPEFRTVADNHLSGWEALQNIQE